MLWDVGYLEEMTRDIKKNTVNILKLELTRYEVFRPKINGICAGYRGPTRH